VDVLETITGSTRWRLRMFSAVLVTSSGVANRQVSLIVDDGTATRRIAAYTEGTPTSITASQTRTLQWQTGTDLSTTAFQSLADTQTVLIKSCLPQDLLLTASFRIRTVTANIAAADAYAAPIYEVEEWLEG